MSTKFIFLSNGYGEDTISTYIIRELDKKLKEKGINFEILGFPLVNTGEKYKENNIKTIGPTKVLKSAGISGLLNLKNFINDIKDGLISFIFNQLNFINEYKNNPKIYLVAVGDIYPLLLSVLKNKFSKTNVIFIPTAKSYKTEPFNLIEIYFMSLVKANFVRDELTYLKLKDKLKNVYFVGNPVLDIDYIKPSENIQLEKNIIILPGRKDFCLKNLYYFIKAINLLLNKITSESVVDILPTFSIIVPNFYPINEVNNLIEKELKKEYKERVYVLSDRYYRYVLESSYLVWGQAGSGNEQAAGYKLPVISFNENNWYRNRQKKLLSNCLILIEQFNIEKLVNETIILFKDKDKYKFIVSDCYKEMGPLGGAINISNYLVNLVSNST